MGFIKAFSDSISGVFSDQWLDFLTVPNDLPHTAAMFPAIRVDKNNSRGINKGSQNIITNGSKIVVPEGYGFITLIDGEITGFITEPGGYIFSNDEQNSKTIFTKNNILSATLETSWERFKFGGLPGVQHLAFFVSLKELPNNRFGTQSEIYWDDSYLGAQVGAITRGSYTLKIVDPILFIKSFVPASYLNGNTIFDFTDFNNPASEQLFNEVVSSLSAAFSRYTNDSERGNRITKIQSDSIGFAQALRNTIENDYQWELKRGISINKVAIQAIEYDNDTIALLSDVKKADALIGSRGNSFLQQSVARGVQGAGENNGGMGLFGLGMGFPLINNMTQGLQQPTEPTPTDPVTKLKQMKELLDSGIITKEEFDEAKNRFLGL